MILLTSGQGRGPMPRELPYVASKAALSGSRRRWRPPRAARITVNAVDPGPTDTGWAAPSCAPRVAAASRAGAGARPTTPRA